MVTGCVRNEIALNGFTNYWTWEHGCFPVKSANYFIAVAPSNLLLNLPFNPLLAKFDFWHVCLFTVRITIILESGGLSTS